MTVSERRDTLPALDVRLRLIEGQLDIDAPAERSADLPSGAVRGAERLAAFAALCATPPGTAGDAMADVLAAPETQHADAVQHLLDVHPNFAALRADVIASVRPRCETDSTCTARTGAELVAIAGPCLICGGTEYRLAAVNGLVLCTACHPELPPPPKRTKRRKRIGVAPASSGKQLCITGHTVERVDVDASRGTLPAVVRGPRREAQDT